MIRIVFITLVIAMTIMSCYGQQKNSDKQSEQNVPQSNIIVNKEYDEQGNIIKYDSTYSYYYSNIEGDTSLKDSIFNNFMNHFNRSYFFSNQSFFKNSFFQDSLLMYDFYKKDFFYDRFKNNMESMDSLFRKMDILKNDFFNKQILPEHR